MANLNTQDYLIKGLFLCVLLSLEESKKLSSGEMDKLLSLSLLRP